MDSYTLRIHHLDFGGDGGDGTLLALWDGAVLNTLVLIDGGSATMGAVTIRRALDTYGISGAEPQTAIVICTHYEDSYYAGLIDVLGFPEFVQAQLWDRGQQGQVSRTDATIATQTLNYWGEASTYTNYKQLVTFLTAQIDDNQKPQLSWRTGILAPTLASFVQTQQWKQPLSFFNGLGGGVLYNDPTSGFSIAVLAADGYAGDSTTPAANNATVDGATEFDNGYALVVSLGAFRYYHGGAITTSQEGGTPNNGCVADASSIANVGNTLTANKVHVAKLSRQGAVTASAPDFLASIGAQVLVVTCGTDRTGGDETDVFAEDVSYPFASLPANLPPGATAYLTGETLASALDGPNVTIAGCWASGAQVPLAFGDITIEATNGGASAPTGFTVNYSASLDAWTAQGANKTYTQVTTYSDWYPLQFLTSPSEQRI